MLVVGGWSSSVSVGVDVGGISNAQIARRVYFSATIKQRKQALGCELLKVVASHFQFSSIRDFSITD